MSLKCGFNGCGRRFDGCYRFGGFDNGFGGFAEFSGFSEFGEYGEFDGVGRFQF